MTSFMNRNGSQAKKYDELTSQIRSKRQLSKLKMNKTGSFSSARVSLNESTFKTKVNDELSHLAELSKE